MKPDSPSDWREDGSHVTETILSANGYKVSALADAGDLFKVVSLERPDAVLLDYQLPGTDGLTALRHLRARNVMVPVIVMTATAEQNTAVQFFRAGATDFITKPFDQDYLAIVVERAISHYSRNLIEKITAMSRYMSHLPDCTDKGSACSCGMREVAKDALETATALMTKGRR